MEVIIDGVKYIPEPPKAAPEPKPEPVKLYCVHALTDWLTVGKTYESTDGRMTVDDGERYVDTHMIAGGYLFPLVQRPAKVGEWVVIQPNATGTARDYIGKAVKILDAAPNGFARSPVNPSYAYPLEYQEYLVLDGYDGRYEQEKPKEPDLSGYEWIDGVKGMDASMRCREMRYVVGEEYDLGHEETLGIGKPGDGYHFCKTKEDVIGYTSYDKPDTRYFKVSGLVKKGSEGPVYCARKIKILEEIKPEYYNGKVVCIRDDAGFTKGKIYQITNGYFIDDDGAVRPLYISPIKNLDADVWGKIFIPFVEG